MTCPKCGSPDAIGYDAMYDYDKPWHYDGVIAWNCRQCGHWYPLADLLEWVQFCDEMNKESE